MKPNTQAYSTTRNYILAFSDLFREIFVVRYNENGTEWKYEEVPVIFPFTEKWIAYQRNRWATRADMNLNYLFEISKTLPMISIGEFKFSKNLSKQHNKNEKMLSTNGSVMATPVSYTLSTKISIYTNLLDDNFQILEQIIPYFAPSYNINVNVGLYSENESVPITLEDVGEVFPMDLEVEDKRLIITELSFSMDVNFYPDNLTDTNTYTKNLTVG